MSQLYIKDDPKGVDKVINELNALVFNHLTTESKWSNYSAYHRAYKNPTTEGIIAEVFDKDDKDYKEVFFNDTLSASSFFVIDDNFSTLDSGRLIDTTVSMIFQVRLDEIANLIDGRADEEIVFQVLHALRQSKYGEISNVARGIDNVYSGFETGQIQYTDMQPFFCFRVDMDVVFEYDCACDYVINEEQSFLLSEMFGYLIYEDGGRIGITT
jgi:hypothetical protein